MTNTPAFFELGVVLGSVVMRRISILEEYSRSFVGEEQNRGMKHNVSAVLIEKLFSTIHGTVYIFCEAHGWIYLAGLYRGCIKASSHISIITKIISITEIWKYCMQRRFKHSKNVDLYKRRPLPECPYFLKMGYGSLSMHMIEEPAIRSRALNRITRRFYRGKGELIYIHQKFRAS